MKKELREKAERRKKKLNIGLNVGVVIHSMAFILGMIHFDWCYGQTQGGLSSNTTFAFLALGAAIVFLAAVIFNLVYAKFNKAGLVVSILGALGFALGVGYSVLYYISEGGKALREATGDNLRMTFTIGRFAFYGFAAMCLAGGLIPAVVGGFF